MKSSAIIKVHITGEKGAGALASEIERFLDNDDDTCTFVDLDEESERQACTAHFSRIVLITTAESPPVAAGRLTCADVLQPYTCADVVELFREATDLIADMTREPPDGHEGPIVPSYARRTYESIVDSARKVGIL